VNAAKILTGGDMAI